MLNQTNQPTNTRQETTNRLTALMNKRNDLIKALDINADLFRSDLDETVNELCETIAQIAVYKTLLKLSDSPKDITQSGADMCANLYRSFALDMHIYRTNDITEIYSDAFDLFTVAYMEIWAYLKSTAPLTLDDTVYTKVLKNGSEKNYTIFQTSCKAIREYIHSWSKTDQYKRLYYLIGYTDKGEAVVTSERPLDTLEDITEKQFQDFAYKYGLTPRESEAIFLITHGAKAEELPKLMGIPKSTAYDTLKRAKGKFATANAYAEYITARNSEKRAKATASKPTADEFDRKEYEKAKERTARALTTWKTAFYKEMRGAQK